MTEFVVGVVVGIIIHYVVGKIAEYYNWWRDDVENDWYE